jgi:hypothetical protein
MAARGKTNWCEVGLVALCFVMTCVLFWQTAIQYIVHRRTHVPTTQRMEDK